MSSIIFYEFVMFIMFVVAVLRGPHLSETNKLFLSSKTQVYILKKKKKTDIEI